MQNEKRIFVIVTIISCVSQMSADIYLPSLTAIAQSLNADISTVQLSITFFMLGITISPLIYGPISDGVGRRIPLLFGLIICVIGSILCFSAKDIYVLNAGRLLQGFGAGAGPTLLRPIFRDLFSETKLAKYNTYGGLLSVAVLALAPVLGGYLQHYYGWSASFIFISVFASFAVLAVLMMLPETNIHLHPENLRLQTIKQNLSIVVTSPIFLGYNFCWLASYAAMLAWITAGPVLLVGVLHLTPIEFGWSYFLTGFTFAIGAIINGKLVARAGIHALLQFGLFCIGFAGVILFLISSFIVINAVTIIGAAMLVTFAAPFVIPNSIAGAFQPFPKIAGIAGGLFESIGRLGGVIGSFLLALSSKQTPLPMAIIFMINAILAWSVFHFIVEKTKQK